jgi:NTP pyrophosphatase (non-canonical NTP hydrolase)
VAVTDDGSAATSAVLLEVATERCRQNGKFGTERIRRQSPQLRLAILMEEVGELARAILERDQSAMRTEAIQVAAVAVALVEGLEQETS